MFTGIVEELGSVTRLQRLSDAVRLEISAPLVSTDTSLGDSIAVNGVCLTVVSVVEHVFTADVMAETLGRSSLGNLSVGDAVNLERAVTPQTRLGGHIMQGHIDATGRVLNRQEAEYWHVVRVELPEMVRRYVVEKGSIALDGVSLTVSAIGSQWCEVSLIPATLQATTWGNKPTDAPVNIEVDVLAKYVERLMRERP